MGDTGLGEEEKSRSLGWRNAGKFPRVKCDTAI